MQIGILLSLSSRRPGVAPAGFPANTAAPSISGGPTVGSTLTATAGTWTGTPTPTITRQWWRNGEAIAGATGATLSTTGYAADDVIVLVETATNAVGVASATSNSITLTAAPSAPSLDFSAPINSQYLLLLEDI